MTPWLPRTSSIEFCVAFTSFSRDHGHLGFHSTFTNQRPFLSRTNLFVELREVFGRSRQIGPRWHNAPSGTSYMICNKLCQARAIACLLFTGSSDNGVTLRIAPQQDVESSVHRALPTPTTNSCAEFIMGDGLPARAILVLVLIKNT